MPNIAHKVYDPKRKTTITIWAYRKLDNTEIQQHALFFARNHKLNRGYRYDVMTSIQ